MADSPWPLWSTAHGLQYGVTVRERSLSPNASELRDPRISTLGTDGQRLSGLG